MSISSIRSITSMLSTDKLAQSKASLRSAKEVDICLSVEIALDKRAVKSITIPSLADSHRFRDFTTQVDDGIRTKIGR